MMSWQGWVFIMFGAIVLAFCAAIAASVAMVMINGY